MWFQRQRTKAYRALCVGIYLIRTNLLTIVLAGFLFYLLRAIVNGPLFQENWKFFLSFLAVTAVIYGICAGIFIGIFQLILIGIRKPGWIGHLSYICFLLLFVSFGALLLWLPLDGRTFVRAKIVLPLTVFLLIAVMTNRKYPRVIRRIRVLVRRIGVRQAPSAEL